MKTKKAALVVLNTVTFALMIFINYASNAHVFNNVNVADIAHKYDTLLMPADYAFIIWSIIFLLNAGFVIYQWVLLKNKTQQYIQRTGLWFLISNMANALWVYCWVHEWIGLSVIIICILLLSLIMLTLRLRLELDDEPVKTILLVWWPIVFYLGWIITATVACIASWLVYIGWNAKTISPEVCTIIMIMVACLIYIFLIIKRNMREAAVIGIWAFIAIAVRQWNDFKSIAATAIIASVILLIFISWHGYKNRYFSPANKIKRKEW